MNENFNYRKLNHLSVLIGTVFILLVIPLTVYFTLTKTAITTKVKASIATHYVACGDTLDSANAAVASSDSLLFQRGCREPWTGTLNLSKSGIYVGAYGSGEMPIIQSSAKYSAEVEITGSNITIENIHAHAVPTEFQSDGVCAGSPKGWIYGFRLNKGTSNITIKNSKATANYAGVYIKEESTNNKILNNKFLNNTMHVFTAPTAGAFGVLVWGDYNEIAYNEISGHDACDPTTKSLRDGAAVEVYGGKNNFIHHNRSSNNDTFSELGSDHDPNNPRTSENNTFAYNLDTSNLPYSKFIVTRGPSDSNYGPVYGTKVINNTAYLIGSGAEGAICSTDCSSSILTLKNNILWVNYEAVYSGAPFDQSNNIYWRTDGKTEENTFIQNKAKWTIAASGKVDPLFVAVGSDFHLTSASPAVNSGTALGYTTDFDGNPVPKGGTPDIGAFEYQTPSSSASQLNGGSGSSAGKTTGGAAGSKTSGGQNTIGQGSVATKTATRSASRSASPYAIKKPKVVSFYKKLAAAFSVTLLLVVIGLAIFYYLRWRKTKKES